MHSVNFTILAYVLYMFITLSLTIWVARTLFRNGKVFLLDIFHGDKPLADSVNNLLLVGFYLINVGYTVYVLRVSAPILDTQEMIEVLSVKVGGITLLLGGMHFLNLFIFFRMRKKALMPVKPAPTLVHAS